MQQKLHTFLDLCKAKTLITPNFPYFIPLRPLSQGDELLAPTARPKPCRETKKDRRKRCPAYLLTDLCHTKSIFLSYITVDQPLCSTVRTFFITSPTRVFQHNMGHPSLKKCQII